MSSLSPRRVRVGERQGNRVHQEDRAWVDVERGLFLVSDGFGGGGSGSEASQIAGDATRDFLEKSFSDRDSTLPFVYRSDLSLSGNLIYNAIVHANRALIQWNKKRSLVARGGCSLVVGYQDGDRFVIGNLGVCSVWVQRQMQLRSLVLPRGRRRMEDPFQEPGGLFGEIPLSALGVDETSQPEVVEARVQLGDRLILHTDGLNEEGVQKVLSDPVGSLEGVLVEDNIALILLEF